MRNLKRVLSLTLASVMLLGMMVVGSSAAVGYDDVSKDDNVEAIEVLQTIEVMVGDERGFGPERPVTRAEMAVVMGKLLSLDYNYYSTTCPFDDVYDWAQGWVGACAANGIVSGRGDGIYDPGSTVTAVEAASMLMRALGYFKYSNDYADGFEVSTVRQGTIIGIFDGVGSSATEPMTRNQVAQMVLNALQSAVVEPDGNTINLTTPDGTVLTGKVNYVSVTSRKDFAYAINSVAATSVGSQNDGAIVELGERLYNGDLKLHDFQVDAFGRPSRQWEYKGTDIGTYEKKELLRKEYTVEVTGKDLYDLLTKSTIEDYRFCLTIDGETEEDILNGNSGGYQAASNNFYFTEGNLVRTNTKGVGGTGKGVLTRVYVDTAVGHETIYVAIINTYLAKATMDYNEKKEEATFEIWGIESIDSNKALVKNTNSRTSALDSYKADRDVKNEDINVEDIKDGDIVLVHVAENEIKEIVEPETLSSQVIGAFKKGSWVNTQGTQYDYANTAKYDDEVLDFYSNNNMKDVTYNVILDEYGYLIGIEQNEDPDQYVFITGNDGGASDLRNKEVEMAGIFVDGTMKVLKVDMQKSNIALPDRGAIVNKWYTYTVNDSGVYTLAEIPVAFTAGKAGQWAQNVVDGGRYVNANSADSYTIDKAHVALVASSDGTEDDMRVYGNEETAYINVSTEVITSKAAYDAQADRTGNGYTQGSTEDSANNYSGGGVIKAVIIDDVDSVSIGVKNTNIVVDDVRASDYVKTPAQGNTPAVKYADDELVVPKSEIYTLYNKDGYVIAAITIGEDQGSSTQYAYVHTSDVKKEVYGHTGSGEAAEGKWSWERDVIINGEIVTLTEVEDSNWAWIDPTNMVQGEWYKISYDADGNVRKTEHSSVTQFNGKYVTAVTNVETTYDQNQDLIILSADYTASPWLGQELSFKLDTLYTDTQNREGFAVAADVKVVYANAELRSGYKTPDGILAHVKWFDEVEDGFTGRAGVEKVLRLIDSYGTGNFYGVLNAVIEDGVATSIIFNDTWAGDAVDQGGKPVTPGSNEYPNVINNLGTLEVRYYGTAPTATEIEQVISEANGGGTVKYAPLTSSVTIGEGLNAREWNVDLIEVVKLSVEGTKLDYVDKNGTGRSNYSGFTANQAYLPEGTAVAAGVSSDATSAYTTDAQGKMDLSGETFTKDVNLVPARQIKLDSTITGKCGDVVIPTGTSNYSIAPLQGRGLEGQKNKTV